MSDVWLDLARDGRRAANRLLTDDLFRSCASRAYYAAYSKMTHLMATTPGVSFAHGREGPSHPGETGTGGIRRLIEGCMTTLPPDRRLKLSDLVGRLYTLRIEADYKPSASIEARDARAAVSIMNTIFDSF